MVVWSAKVFPAERLDLAPSWCRAQVPIGRTVREHDLEQFAEKLVYARIGRTGRLRPGGGFRQRLVISTVNGKEIENARPGRPGTGRRSEERRVGKEGRSRWSPYH